MTEWINQSINPQTHNDIPELNDLLRILPHGEIVQRYFHMLSHGERFCVRFYVVLEVKEGCVSEGYYDCLDWLR